jgi:hypothetical protein
LPTDVISGRTRADAVCRSGFCVDVHGLAKDGPAYGNEGVRAKPFDVPLGSLVAANSSLMPHQLEAADVIEKLNHYRENLGSKT